MVSPASNSLVAAWIAAVGSKNGAPDISPDTDTASGLTSLTYTDVITFVASIECRLNDWAQLFTQVPSQHERRKEALGGAVKMKSAVKRFMKVTETLTRTKGETSDGNEGDVNDDTKTCPNLDANSTPVLREALIECQATFRDAVLGLLEVSFPVDELINSDDFADAAGVSAAMQRTQTVVDFTESLGTLFATAKLDPKPTSQVNGKADDPLAPEVLKMLEKTMKKQKKKDKKTNSASADAKSNDLNAAKAVWEQTDGRCSCVLGEEVWEGLNWRRGSFVFSYIKFLLAQGHRSEDVEDVNAAASGTCTSDAIVSPQLVSRAVFVDAMSSFRRMLLAQGPVPSDSDDPALWQASSDGPHQDQTARMFYHGIYTGSHLRALKFMAELSYDQWRHGGQGTADAELAALLNVKFVHVVRHVMPGAGWTADVEYERIVEIEGSARGSSTTFAAGLIDKQDSMPKLASDKSKSKKGKAGGYGAGNVADVASAVSSTAPAAATAASAASASSSSDEEA